MMWRQLKVDENCYFISNNSLTSDKEDFIKNIFEKVGFFFNGSEHFNNEHKYKFTKRSITKIKNWEYLRQIHMILEN